MGDMEETEVSPIPPSFFYAPWERSDGGGDDWSEAKG